MVWNLAANYFRKNDKSAEDPEKGEKERFEKHDEENQKFNLREFLASEHFVSTYTWEISMITCFFKFLQLPCYFWTNDNETLRNLPFPILLYAFFCANFFVRTAWVGIHRGYRRKEYVREEFRWGHLLTDMSVYANIYDFLAMIVLPIYLSTQGIMALPELILGIILIPFNLCILYGFYHCDFLPFIVHNDSMTMYDSYEENYEPAILAIQESTNDYITIKNMSDKELKMDLHVTRQVTEQRKASEGNGIETVTISYTSFRHTMNAPIAPAGVFKFVTVEYKATDGEAVIPVTFLRSFGPKKGETVITFASFSHGNKGHTVQLVQKFQFPRQTINADSRRRVRRDVIVV